MPTTPVAVTSDLLSPSVYGCIHDRVWKEMPGESGRWCVAFDRGLTDQPSQATGSVFGHPTLQAPDRGEAHVGEDQQPHHGGVHQQAGWSSVCCPAEDGGEPVVVGLLLSLKALHVPG